MSTAAPDSSSISSISSPPQSPPPQNVVGDEIKVAARVPPASALGGGVFNSASQPDLAADKPKRQRKTTAKVVDGNEPVKEKKPRKPREPKVKKEGEPSAPRKRQKTIPVAPASNAPAANASASAPATGPRQSTLDFPSASQQPQPPQYPPPPPRSENMPRSSLPPTQQQSRPQQFYDPIRGSVAAPSAQASPHINRASASPSITSLIDPHPATSTSAPVLSYSSQTPTMQQHQPPPPFVPSQQQSPTPPRAAPVQVASSAPPQPAASVKPFGTTMDGAMDIDGPACAPSAKPDIKIHSKSSSSAPTPKPAPAKATSPPKATGSGLLSSSDLFGGPSSNSGTDRKGVDIEIRISLDPNGGNQVNIAQEIAKKYGQHALNPRAAAHREALLRVAAAQHKIDGGSADDMSVDLMSEVEGDSNVEMGGMDEEKSNTGADDKPVRKRKKKVEEYDKEDDFIDDTELAWQEKAAVAKDGFFVYSGPLVPEGQAAQVESNAPTRGGRGRGRGRGRAAAAAGTTHAQLAEKNKDPNAPTGRGRGRGRGTGAPRKPRITKADRERMEAEKAERERAAGGGTMGPAGSGTPAMGATPTLVVQQQPHVHSNGYSSTQQPGQGLPPENPTNVWEMLYPTQKDIDAAMWRAPFEHENNHQAYFAAIAKIRMTQVVWNLYPFKLAYWKIDSYPSLRRHIQDGSLNGNRSFMPLFLAEYEAWRDLLDVMYLDGEWERNLEMRVHPDAGVRMSAWAGQEQLLAEGMLMAFS
ncbi:hypothetical protein PRZ48_011369 [Zasmidium cellare]|uniref:Hpc2-related domain-containing protein n=1 Tax=Zasmidium cellare TaxID=395010 RepID=A0ABR0E6C8_ZASCE|nr:hypothetical protein PRZ48_011369 [Zasmidium cellare]